MDRKIPITKGHGKKKEIVSYLIIDEIDFDMCSNYNIYLNFAGYPAIKLDKKPVAIHRLILQAPTGTCIDHINHDKCDARRCNLRIASPQENASNLKLAKNNTSGYRGVYKTKHGRWKATVRHFGKEIYCGVYDDIKDAAQAAANKRAELGYLDNGILPNIVLIEHKRNKIKGQF